MIEAKIQKWGNSFGIRIPKDELEEKNLSENEEIIVEIRKKGDMASLFGLHKFRQPVKKVIKEAKEGSF